ncbi:flagellar basal-body MS-ring/collar protein FliF [Flavisphingomonas formosensis]|uniref:flagellar basal-body MS-ring/collar protein FliF n=1 Tax=Flavisphingomonas formosensis TaxID=861534 RepID=UPI0012FA9FCD|nr:flagellar basal-body MS-ring/collar protein FliF [Sphingomonas formosensis]
MLDRFRSASPRAQMLFVAALSAVLLALMLVAWLLLREPYRPLFTRLRPADAATIVADLDKRKIDYRLADGGSTILVPANAVEKTRLGVMTGDLPLKGTVGFELFNKSDMGLTDFAQRINYQRALQGELERTIMSLDNVESARVHLSLGEDRLFREDRVPPKASVTIRTRDGTAIDEATAAGLQRLIAAAVPRLETDAVVILDYAGDVVSAAQPSSVAAVTPATAEQLAIGQYYEARVREAIEASYPGDMIGVSVTPIFGEAGEADHWDPAARSFPLAIILAPKTSLDAGAQADLRTRVASAIGADPSRGDSIRFGTLPQAGQAALAPPASARHAAASVPLPDDQAEEPKWRLHSVLWPAIAIGLVLVLILVLRGRAATTLSDAERADLAARLRHALDTENGAAHGL